MLTTMRDYDGIVHLAKRPTSVFSKCSADQPTMESFTISLVYGTADENGVVTCLMCIGGSHGEG